MELFKFKLYIYLFILIEILLDNENRSESCIFLDFTNPYIILYSTTVIVKIKGKPCSLFCNTCTVIEKLMHIIIYIESKSVDLICEYSDVLVNFTSWI
jgi:hypothetical protein